MNHANISTYKHLPLIALCFGFFMVIIDATIINVALPVVAKDLHGNIADLQWIVAGYALTFACFLLTAGSLGDDMGYKNTFIMGLIIFILTSLGCAVSNNFLILTLFRLLQGVGAAMLVPTSLALIHGIYEDPIARAKAIGIWGGVGGIAAACGPILGALLATWFGWRAIFLINVPVGCIGLWLTFCYVASPQPKPSTHMDILGQLCAIISIATLAFGLIEAGRLGWDSLLVIISLMIFMFTSLLFIYVEKRAAEPMLPLTFFKTKMFSTAIVIGVILNISFYGELFLLPLYFQHIRGYSVLETGFALLPMTGVVAVSSYFSGKVASKSGTHLPMIVGLSIGAMGFFSLLMLQSQSPTYLAIILPLVAVGFGISFTMPAATIAAVTSVAKERAGLASGALNASRQVGSLLGVAIFGTIVGTQSFIQGLHVTLIIAALAFLLGGGLLLGQRNKVQ